MSVRDEGGTEADPKFYTDSMNHAVKAEEEELEIGYAAKGDSRQLGTNEERRDVTVGKPYTCQAGRLAFLSTGRPHLLVSLALPPASHTVESCCSGSHLPPSRPDKGRFAADRV